MRRLKSFVRPQKKLSSKKNEDEFIRRAHRTSVGPSLATKKTRYQYLFLYKKVRLDAYKFRKFIRKYSRPAGSPFRVAPLIILALLIAFSPILSHLFNNSGYDLSYAASQLVNTPDKHFAKLLSYDSHTQSFDINQRGLIHKNTVNGPYVQAGQPQGGLYSAVLPSNLSKGVSITERVNDLGFTIKPSFKTSQGEKINGRVVYPLGNGNVQAVYTPKATGIAEDIVINRQVGDVLSFPYQLQLPKEMKAFNLQDGSIAIESGGNIVFSLQAPTIKENNGKTGGKVIKGAAKLILKGKQIVLLATGLSKLSYPLTIDPSITINTSTPLLAGNNEGGLSVSNSQVSTGGLTGGSLSGGWTATTSLPVNTYSATSVEYDGYVYEIAGASAGSLTGNVEYAPINSNGTIGTWLYTTSLPALTSNAASVAYNGYVYEIGGYAGGASQATVYYAPVNANGSLGSWAVTSPILSATDYLSAGVYSGYIYAVGGNNGSIDSNVYYTKINADGTLGTWASTTSLLSVTATPGVVTYNGYIYIVGGNTGSYTATVDYAPINSNGTLGAWVATTSLPAITNNPATSVYDGYIYSVGGDASGGVTTTVVNYAQINANGSVGPWLAATSLPAATDAQTGIAYNGYVYNIGGENAVGSSYTAVVDYAKIDSAGWITSPDSTDINTWGNTSTLPYANIKGTHYFTSNAGSIVYDGYVYEIGGAENNSAIATVDYAAINSNGTLGTWASTTSLPTATSYPSSVEYNGYVYVIGGNTNTSVTTTVDYAPISSSGTLGTWAATTSLPVSNSYASAVVYNGYVYEMGGMGSTVDYAPVNSNGTLGSWTATTSLPAAAGIEFPTSVVSNGYVYYIGGQIVGGATVSTVYYAPISSNGTLGSWTATTSLPTADYSATSVVYNGYVYEIGGYNGSAAIASVYYAPISSNGTLGAWTATTSLPTATQYATSVVYNGYVYEIGTGTTLSDPNGTVSYATINNGGPGTTGSYTATASLLAGTDSATSVVYNGYVYEIGGATTGAVATVYYAPINANGTLGSWTATTSLLAPTYNASSVVYNGYVYEIGGFSGSAAIATVDYAPINANGTLGSWTATTSLLAPTQQTDSVVYNGYVYEIGGVNSSGAVIATVDYAPINSNGTIGTWTATTSLSTGTRLSASVVYNGYVYNIGGFNSSGAVIATVDYAPINSNGTIGTWTATTSLPATTSEVTSVVYNGYVYEIGGFNGSATITSVDYAAINANGTLGTWTATTSLPAATDQATSVVYNGYVYEIGGFNGSATITTVDYAQLNSIPRVGNYSLAVDIGLDTQSVSSGVSQWTATTSLPTVDAYSTSVVYSGYVYELGGYGGSGPISTVAYAPTQSTGGLGTQASCPTGWTLSGGSWCYNTTSIPTATDGGTAVTYNGYVYYMGGYTGSADTQTVSYAPLLTTGGLGTQTSCPTGWTLSGGTWCYDTTSLPAITEESAAVVYDGYIYQIGGYVNSAYSSAVYDAPINANGSIGAWNTLTSLPNAAGYDSAVVYNGYVYEVGGYNGSADTQTVSYAPLLTTGGLGTQTSCPTGWTLSGGTWCYDATSLPHTNEGQTAIANNGYIYELGGYTNASYTNYVFGAPINANGSVGSWTATNDIPEESYKGTTVVSGAYVYELGGYTGVNYLNNVDYASFPNSTIGGVDVTPNSIISLGSNSGNPGNGEFSGLGGISVTYIGATRECSTYSAASTVDMTAPELTTPYKFLITSDGCGNSTSLSDVVWVHYHIDDSQTATFPDIYGNHTTITGFQIFYDPNAGLRLRGGATFNNQNLQSLDAPPTTTQ